MIKLKKNERLVYAGETALRAPDGTPLPSVPQFVIVGVDEAAGGVVELQKNERLILAGRVFNQKKRAEERFAALKAGREQPPREVGTPLYVIENVETLNQNEREQESLNADIAKDITALFSLHMRKEKVAARRDKKVENCTHNN